MGRTSRRGDGRPQAVTLADLTPDPHNYRTHPDRNLAAIRASLEDVGAARSIVIDEGNVILAGNGVTAAALAHGLTKLRIVDAEGDEVIAVRRSGLTDDQKRALALFDNRTAELAAWDVELLKSDGDLGTIDLAAFWSPEELALLLGRTEPRGGLTDPDDVPPVRATTIALGDVFELGRHRLACGDSTDRQLVEQLLAGVTPHLMVTDPPYGVDYDPEWRAAAGLNNNRRKMGVVANDDRVDWSAAWALFPGDVAYVWHAGRHASEVQSSLERASFEIRCQVIWAKDRFAFSRGHYHWQHEPCWYAVRSKGTGHWQGDRSQSTLWHIATREDGGHGHGTQKPVECMRRPMANNSSPGQAIYEPFSGSGTTIIAAEQTDRCCLAIEIDPSYVQVAIDRWEAFTGQTARKV